MEQVNNYNFKNSTFEYLLLTFIILWSGGGFTYALFPYWTLYGVLVVGYVFSHRNLHFNSHDVSLIVGIAIILLLQMIKFHGAFISIILPICAVLVTCMSSKILSNKFPIVFERIIYFFALISLFFWIINIIPGGNSLLFKIANSLPQLGWQTLRDMEGHEMYQGVRTLYFYTVYDDVEFLPRNAGPFWEPGRYVIFLILALAINLFYNKKPVTCKRNIVLLLTIITTFSTTGYIALSAILFGYICYSNLNTRHRVIFTLMLVVACYYVWQLDFMGDKLNEQATAIDTEYSRFGAIFFHWSQIIKSPFIGYGPYIIKTNMNLLTSPNGLTDLIRYFGIPFAAVLYILLYRSTKVYVGVSVNFRVFTFVAILLLCFSQTITHSTFFYLLYFFGLNNSQYEKAK